MNNRKMTENGFGLIEALIAVLVLAIGLLGLATLQAQGLRNNNSAYFRTQASIQISSMFDTMRVDLAAARAGNYNISMRDNSDAHCEDQEQIDPDTIASIAQQRLYDWKELLREALPYGDGAISCSDSGCSIAVRWDDGLTDGGSFQPAKYFSSDTAKVNKLNQCSESGDRRALVVETRL